jgi:hypothetical protein
LNLDADQSIIAMMPADPVNLQIIIEPSGPRIWKWTLTARGGRPVKTGVVKGARSKAILVAKEERQRLIAKGVRVWTPFPFDAPAPPRSGNPLSGTVQTIYVSSDRIISGLSLIRIPIWRVVMDDHSKRDFLLIIAVVIIVPFTVWLTFTVLDRLFVLTDPYDPLTTAGGLKPEQEVIHAKWSLCVNPPAGKFDDPIPLQKGRRLVTLEDAAKYIQKLPKTEQQLHEWQAAVEALLLVVEHNGPTMMARIGVMRALNRNVVREFNPDRKDTHWGKRKLKRDEWA